MTKEQSKKTSLVEAKDAGFLAYWAVAKTLRLFSPTFRIKNALRVSRLCSRIWLALSPSERERTMQNLRMMVGDRYSEAELERFNRLHHDAHVWAFIVPSILPQLSHEQIREMTEVRGLEHLEAARAQGRGAVLLSAHIGTHGYVLIAALVAHGVPVTAVTGREGIPAGQDEPDGSWVYRNLVHPLREEPRAHLPFLTRGLVPDRKMLKTLQRNEALWIQGDMHLTEKDVANEHHLVTVPFLWGEAPFRSGPIRLPKAFNAPVLPTFAVREGSKLIVIIEEPLTLQPDNSYEAMAADMRAYLERLEQYIQASPDQWAFTRHENLPKWIRSRSGNSTQVTVTFSRGVSQVHDV